MNECPSPNRMGYMEWHAMADRLVSKGQKQTKCTACGLWKFRCEAEQCAHFKPSKKDQNEDID